jgi:hypothetical protein
MADRPCQVEAQESCALQARRQRALCHLNPKGHLGIVSLWKIFEEAKHLYLSAGISDFTTMCQVRATLAGAFC